MKLVFPEEMQELDRRASEEFGVPSLLLMDSAAKAVADVVRGMYDEEKIDYNKPVVIFCGKGNNGGDGIGAARWLMNYGLRVKVYLVNCQIQGFQGDSAYELNMLLHAGCRVESIFREEDLTIPELLLKTGGIAVDAMLGTGFKGELEGLYKAVAKLLNNTNIPVVAVDIPTGVNGKTGAASEDAVIAKATVTMALPKTGLMFYPGKEKAGRVLLADIGMPDYLRINAPGNKFSLSGEAVKVLLPIRKPNAHKGDAGKVIILAGSPGFVGAAAMASRAAVKAGAGLVSLLTPFTSQNILATKLDEVMVHGLLERAPGILGGAAAGDIVLRANKADVLAMGPGLGTHESTQQVIVDILPKLEVPVIIDADALTALKDHTEVLKEMQAPKVLTPHYGEMARLTGLEIEEIAADPLSVAAKYAAEWKATVVLKGAPTVIAGEDGCIFVNTTGSNVLATGGTGDVLTGIIAGLAGQEISLYEAALCGVYLHGLAGSLASQEVVGLAASEIIDKLQEARQETMENSGKFAKIIYNYALQEV